MRIKVFVINLNGVKTACECDEEDTIEILMDRISAREGIPKNGFTLKYRERPIKELEETLFDNGITKDSIVTMVQITQEVLEQQDKFRLWFPEGVFTSSKKYSVSSRKDEMMKDFTQDLDRNVLNTASFRWNLENLGHVLSGVTREMDEFDEKWKAFSVGAIKIEGFFIKERREKIIDNIYWNYIKLDEMKRTDEGLGEDLPNQDQIKSYEKKLQEFRNPELSKISMVDKNGSLKLKELENKDFIYDSSSWDLMERERKRILEKKQRAYKEAKLNRTKSQYAKLEKKVEVYKNQANYLRKNYFRPINELAMGLEKREMDPINTLTIKGEFLFESYRSKLERIYRDQLESELMDLNTILKGLNRCPGIKCLKFDLKKADSPEQQMNVSQFLFKISEYENMKNTLVYLDLSGMTFSSECMNAVLKLIQSSALEHLALNRCQLKEEMKPSGNRIEAVDPEIFEKLVLAFSKSLLKSIELQHNNLDDDAVKKLCKNLEECRPLKRLDISNNPCTGASTNEIVHLIENSGLVSLNISNTKISGTRMNSILLEAMSSNSRIEYIGIEGSKDDASEHNVSDLWKFLCCNFCLCIPSLGDSSCCINLLGCLKTKINDHTKVDRTQRQYAADINKKADQLWKKKQLEANVKRFLSYHSAYQDRILELDAANGFEAYERKKKRKEEKMKKEEEAKQFLLQKAENRSSKTVNMTVNTNNATNDNTQTSQETKNAITDSFKPMIAQKEHEPVPVKEIADPEPAQKAKNDKKVAPMPTDPMDIIAKMQDLTKAAAKLE